MWGHCNPERVRDWESAKRYLEKGRHPEYGRHLANNTRLRYDNGDYVIRFHSTDIVTYCATGDVVILDGGWRTVTTRDRISEYAPVSISTVKHVWYMQCRRHTYVFEPCVIPKDKRMGPRVLHPVGLRNNKLVTMAQEAAEKRGRAEAARSVARSARLLLKYGFMKTIGSRLVAELEAAWNRAFIDHRDALRGERAQADRSVAGLLAEEGRLQLLKASYEATRLSALNTMEELKLVQQRVQKALLARDAAHTAEYGHMEQLQGKQMRSIQLEGGML